jgi:hypothetical protein
MLYYCYFRLLNIYSLALSFIFIVSHKINFIHYARKIDNNEMDFNVGMGWSVKIGVCSTYSAMINYSIIE